jgi:hypothetical protein
MAIKGQEGKEIFFQNNKTPSPTRSKGKSVRISLPRQVESPEREKRNIRFGSPNGKHRASPSKDRSPRSSPSHSDYYAGFSEPPAPTALPIPPTHWMAPLPVVTKPVSFMSGSCGQNLLCNLQEFNMLVQVQA